MCMGNLFKFRYFKVLVDSDTVKKHKKLLVGGVWCISDIEYTQSEEKGVCPWTIILLSRFNYLLSILTSS